MALPQPATDEEDAAREAIARAALAADGGMPQTFTTQLFGRAVPEDVVRYGAEDLAALAAGAWSFLAQRAMNKPKIRCDLVKLAASGVRTAVTVVEIINDDMPFLVDSVMGELNERGIDIHLVAHPVLGVDRDAAGRLMGIVDTNNAAQRESFIHIHLEPIADESRRADIVRALETVLEEVRLAVQDWQVTLARVNAMVTELKTNPPPMPVDEIAEAIQFLQWLIADNFT
ncbi:MAG: NAD-glutamate dehydrogenase, partial [Pseudolabrys sp.]